MVLECKKKYFASTFFSLSKKLSKFYFCQTKSAVNGSRGLGCCDLFQETSTLFNSSIWGGDRLKIEYGYSYPSCVFPGGCSCLTTSLPSTQQPTTQIPSTQFITIFQPSSQLSTTSLPSTQFLTTIQSTNQISSTQTSSTNQVTNLPSSQSSSYPLASTSITTTSLPSSQQPMTLNLTQEPITQIASLLSTTQLQSCLTQQPTTQMQTTNSPNCFYQVTDCQFCSQNPPQFDQNQFNIYCSFIQGEWIWIFKNKTSDTIYNNFTIILNGTTNYIEGNFTLK